MASCDDATASFYNPSGRRLVSTTSRQDMHNTSRALALPSTLRVRIRNKQRATKLGPDRGVTRRHDGSVPMQAEDVCLAAKCASSIVGDGVGSMGLRIVRSGERRRDVSASGGSGDHDRKPRRSVRRAASWPPGLQVSTFAQARQRWQRCMENVVPGVW
ncbi:hypothetical protein TCAP_02019 [Tolypocladium capitatum]|uniref:Uncharacterized protein n=1 Tax=Tolypocladium capitatum TaxID=45235 RepID=A0A2K3QKJ6_9HYPO|nr:hypothetical protein TCAP_02019 [Tolypocladium capitatum]